MARGNFLIVNIVIITVMKLSTLASIFVISLCAIVLSFGSQFFTSDRIYERSDIEHVEFGWPFRFVTQDQSRFDPPLPYDMDIAWEVPTTYNFQLFGYNSIFYFLLLNVFYLFATLYRKNIEK